MRHSGGIVTTLSIFAIALLIIVLAVGFAKPTRSVDFEPPTPLVLSSSRVYEEWLTYNYTGDYLSSIRYTLNAQLYQSLLDTLTIRLHGSREIVYHIDGSYATVILLNREVVYKASEDSFPAYTITSLIYVPQERAAMNYTFTVVSPIRYYIAEQLGSLLLGLPNNSSAAQVENAVDGLINGFQGVSGILELVNSGQTTYAWFSVTDCYLKVYYQTCPVYTDWELIYQVLPNLTFGFSSPA